MYMIGDCRFPEPPPPPSFPGNQRDPNHAAWAQLWEWVDAPLRPQPKHRPPATQRSTQLLRPHSVRLSPLLQEKQLAVVVDAVLNQEQKFERTVRCMIHHTRAGHDAVSVCLYVVSAITSKVSHSKVPRCGEREFS